MTLVLVVGRKEKIDIPQLVHSGKCLRQAVADYLSCSDEGGQLLNDDVEVHIRTRDDVMDSLSPEKYDVQVFVFADLLPARQKNLPERCQAITSCLNAVLGGRQHGFVKIFLSPSAYSEF